MGKLGLICLGGGTEKYGSIVCYEWLCTNQYGNQYQGPRIWRYNLFKRNCSICKHEMSAFKFRKFITNVPIAKRWSCFSLPDMRLRSLHVAKPQLFNPNTSTLDQLQEHKRKRMRIKKFKPIKTLKEWISLVPYFLSYFKTQEISWLRVSFCKPQEKSATTWE